MAIGWLGNNAHIADARLLDGVHHGSESSKGNILIGAQIDRLVLRIANLLLQAHSDLVDVDGVVAEKYSLRLINADHQPLFGNLLDGAGMRHVDFDSRLRPAPSP
jgi:hypothetical protein